ILEAIGLPIPTAMQGESLIPLVRLKPDTTEEITGGRAGRSSSAGRSPAAGPSPVVSGVSRTGQDRPAYAETEYPLRAFGSSPLTAWRADRFLYIRAPSRELYDEVADPSALHNIAGSRTRVADGIEGELQQFLRRTSGAAVAAPRVDPALAERLAALGYVGG